MGSTCSSGRKQLCQQADQAGEKSFILGLMWERDDDLQSSEEVVELDGKQGLEGNVDKRDLVIKKQGRKVTIPSICTQVRKLL